MEFIFQLFAEMLGKNEYMGGIMSDSHVDETPSLEEEPAREAVEGEVVPEANIFNIVNFH